MSTLVCFHAHPDDEAITTGGLMRKASDAGHDVVLVVATRGENGEVQPETLKSGEQLSERRVAEVSESARILGAKPPIFLGYEDSGMMGEDSNENPACFWKANIEEAAGQLAAVLTEVNADIVTIYDQHGLYGHPDHIQVHRVGLAAARIAGIENVFEATVNRAEVAKNIVDLRARIEASGGDASELPGQDELEEFGVAHEDLAYVVDVSNQVNAKRASLRAHKSQVSEQSLFLDTSDEEFALMFGQEWFGIPGRTGTGGPQQVDFLPGLNNTKK